MTLAYTAGTITLTNGSKAVTGIGTGWVTALIAGGVIYPDASGNALPIKTVNSNTSITVDVAWKGATGTYSYAIVRDTAYLQQLSANAQALATYISRLDNAALAAFAAIAGTLAAGKVPRGLSGTTMEWMDVTDAAKGLLSGTALTRNGSDYTLAGRLFGTAVTQSPLDTTTARLLKTGDFGIGIAITLTAADNLDAVLTGGSYYNPTGGNTTGNNYPVNSAGSLLVIAHTSTRVTQVYISYGGNSTADANRMFVRSYGNAGFAPWVEVFNQGTILRTVSQSGGIPTGGVLSRGSNANGEFVRFADGTQICTRSFSASYDINNAAGSIWATTVLASNFAANFADTASTSVILSCDTLPAADIWPGYSRANGVGVAQFRLLAGRSLAGQTVGLKMTAVGRWY